MDMGNPESISTEFNKAYKRKLDWKMLLILALLLLINFLLFTTVAIEKNSIEYFYINIMYVAIGIIISIILYFINYKKSIKFYIRHRYLRSIS